MATPIANLALTSASAETSAAKSTAPSIFSKGNILLILVVAAILLRFDNPLSRKALTMLKPYIESGVRTKSILQPVWKLLCYVLILAFGKSNVDRYVGANLVPTPLHDFVGGKVTKYAGKIPRWGA
jgi:hypothetical protein